MGVPWRCAKKDLGHKKEMVVGVGLEPTEGHPSTAFKCVLPLGSTLYSPDVVFDLWLR